MTLCRLALPGALAALMGCSVGNQIDVRDTTVFPAARFTYDILQGIREKKAAKEQKPEKNPEEPEAPKKPQKPVQGSLIAEVDLDFARGSSRQTSEAGGIDFADKFFPGSTSYDADYFVFRGAGIVRGGFWVKDTFGLEGYVGFSGWKLDLKIDSGAMSASNSSCSFGYVFGAQLSLRPIHEITIYGRACYGGAVLLQQDGVGGMTLLEVGASIKLVAHISVFGGYRGWEIGEARSGASDIDLKLSGPLVGIELGF